LLQRAFKPIILAMLLFCSSVANDIASDTIYISYNSKPSMVYENEIFSVEYRAIIPVEFDEVKLNFEQSNLELFKYDSNWKSTTQKHIYTKELFFKALKTEKLSLPSLKLDVFKDSTLVANGSIDGSSIVVQPISTYSKQFSQILAENLSITNYKIRQYNNDFLIAILEINIYKGNAKDFYLAEFKEQGIESIKGEMPRQKVFYYALVPNYYSELTLEYFNLINKNFKQITIPIDIDSELISTQAGLNPNNSSLDLYKKFAILSFVVILLAIFVYRKKWVYLVLVTPFIVGAFFIFTPPKKATIKANTKVQILPTPKSTVFYIIQLEGDFELIKEGEKYSKIILKNESIGWIKNENIKQIKSNFFFN
jgi:hypothetical protein